TECAQGIEQVKQKRGVLSARITAEDARLQAVGAELTKLAAVLERVKQYDRQKQTLVRQEEELARLPADTHEAVEAGQRRCDELTVVERAAPLLERLATQRDGLKKALAAEAADAQKEQTIKAGGEKLRVRHEELKKRTEEATRKREQADRELAAAQALFEQL